MMHRTLITRNFKATDRLARDYYGWMRDGACWVDADYMRVVHVSDVAELAMTEITGVVYLAPDLSHCDIDAARRIATLRSIDLRHLDGEAVTHEYQYSLDLTG